MANDELEQALASLYHTPAAQYGSPGVWLRLALAWLQMWRMVNDER